MHMVENNAGGSSGHKPRCLCACCTVKLRLDLNPNEYIKLIASTLKGKSLNFHIYPFYDLV